MTAQVVRHLALIATTVSCACATPSSRVGTAATMAQPPGSNRDTATLEARVAEYWKARQAKDLASAWSFYCAEYRARVAQPQYMQMTRLNRFNLLDIQVTNVRMNGQKADVTISYHFMLPKMPDQKAEGQATDEWAKGSDGLWCKEDEPLRLFPPSPPGPGDSQQQGR